jgi:D-amino-acid oxidase
VLRGQAEAPGTGVRIATGVEAMPAAGPPPVKLAALGGFTPCEPGSLPAGFACGWRYSAPLVHMSTYLGYLLGRFERAGGRLVLGTVTSLAGAARAAGARAVVNCAGTGAHHLVPDPAVTAVRGQVVIAANPGLSEFFIGLPGAGHELVYVFPHGGTVVLGGTEVAGDWALEPYPAVAERILRDCAAAVPALAGARVLGHRVGLRPVRPTVRLERAGAGDGFAGPLVHNYGHGGGGVTLSWGCAREAAALVTSGL